jgi:putative oxidoreductase
MFDSTATAPPRDRLGDWMLRGAIAFVFVLFRMEKFPSAPDAEWVKFFDQVGFGQWFRYVTGVVEIVGGVLVAIPLAARAGLAIVAATMAAAVLIHVFVLHHPANGVIPGLLFAGLAAFWWNRRGSERLQT